MAGNAREAKTKSEVIADFITGFDLDGAPVELIGIAETAFIDTIGVMLAGSREPAARKVADMIAAEGAAPAAHVVGRGLRSSTQNAALANGTATQALDYDLSFMIGQSTAALIPALLPLAETTDAAPRDLIAAFIIGTEVCGALARCFPTLSSEAGWHGTGVLGTIGGAAACAALTRQPGDLIPSIIGISASMASSVSTNFGTMTKPLHGGLAARNAIAAVSLGGAGFTANSGALEGQDGFFSSFAQEHAWNTDGFDSLGHEFALLDPGYKIKAFACGGLLHCGIEAALKLRDREKPAIDDISRIVIGVGPHAKKRAIDRYPWSEDSSRFCINYLVAYALIHGAPMVEAFTEAGYGDGAVRGLAERCETVLDDEFASLTGSVYSPGRVTIEMADGTHLEEAVYKPAGTRTTPLSATKIREKFDACATPVIGADRAAALYTTLSALAAQGSLRDLWPMIAPGESGSG
jgi:2-methylcitrate dehydratase PrpD